MAVPVLTGDRVVLRPVRPGDVLARQELGWHAAIERNYGHGTATGPMTVEQARAWYDEQVRLCDDPTGRRWVIEVAGQLAGVAFLHSLSEVDRKARFAIGMFAPRFLGLGLGTEATRLVLAHAFGEMALHRVDLRVLAFNGPAIACYERCGFRVEGRERESCLLDGHAYDDVIMGVLAPEFAALGT